MPEPDVTPTPPPEPLRPLDRLPQLPVEAWRRVRQLFGRQARLQHAFLAAVVVLVHCTLVYREFCAVPRYSDEMHHYQQIERFCHGDFTLMPRLTSIPGYHVLGMLVGRATGDDSLNRMRSMNVVLGVLATLVFGLGCRAAGSQRAALRTLQLYFLPVLLPYVFVVYADVISVLFNVLMLWLLLSRRPRAAGAVGSLAILVRQTNVGWLPLVIVWVLLEDAAWREAERPWRALLARVWPTLVGFVGFAAFVAWNGGSIALGAKGAFSVGLHLGNVFFFLFLFFWLFLPGNLFRLWQHRSCLRDPLLAWLIVAGGLVFMATFPPDHPFNKFPGFLHNELLSYARGDLFLRLLFYVPVAGGIAAVYVARLFRPALYAIYPLALVGLLPLRFVEHRYSIPALVLFLLLRKDEPRPIEALGLGLSMVLSTLGIYVIARGFWGL